MKKNKFGNLIFAIMLFCSTFTFNISESFGQNEALKIKKSDAPIIYDANGRSIKVERPFKRIISLYGAHTENLFYLGLDSEIIGVARNESYPEAAKKKPVFSAQEDPEKFLGSGADLVLVRPMIERGYPDLIKRLEQSKIAVISLQPGTVDEMYDYWLALGVLTGREVQAEKMVADFKERVEFYKSNIDKQIAQNKITPKRVYFEAIHSKMKTFTPGSMALFALQAAGGINVAVDAAASRGTNIGNYGKEKILSHAGKIDVYLAQNGVMNQVSVDMIKNEPGFGIIKAVKENEIYIIDEMIVSRPCFRLLQGIEQITNILYKK